jgi:hypothetical protein
MQQPAPYENIARGLASLGRYEDDYIVHAAEGETVIPAEVFESNPSLKQSLYKQMRAIGIENPERYVVGNELNSINPDTGQPEFFLKGLGKTFKKALPMIGSVVGFALGGPTGAAIGGGLGGLASGQSPEQALMTAGLSFAGAKYLGPGLDKGIAAATGSTAPTLGSLAGQTAAGASGGGFLASLGSVPVGTAAAAALAPMATGAIEDMFSGEEGEVGPQDRRSVVDKYYAALARGENPPLPDELTPPPQDSLFGTGQTIASTNPQDYISNFDAVTRDTLGRPVFGRPMFRKANVGGYIKGPGGPLDDKIPTLLSNTEFVQTGKAVAGADPSGNNNPDKGAKVMMGIMRAFERRADNNKSQMA